MLYNNIIYKEFQGSKPKTIMASGKASGSDADIDIADYSSDTNWSSDEEDSTKGKISMGNATSTVSWRLSDHFPIRSHESWDEINERLLRNAPYKAVIVRLNIIWRWQWAIHAIDISDKQAEKGNPHKQTKGTTAEKVYSGRYISGLQLVGSPREEKTGR